MCHLILLMPVLSLPIFWLVPLKYAIPMYIIIVLLSGLLYWLIAKAMRIKPATGAENLLGAVAEVVSGLAPREHAKYLVRVAGELWRADSTDTLQPGELVHISALNGMKLTIERNHGELSGPVQRKGK